MRTFLRILILALIGFTCIVNLWNGPQDYSESSSAGTKLVSVFVIGSGILALPAFFTLLLRHRSAFIIVLIWSLLTAASGITAAYIYNEKENALTAAIPAALSLAVIFIPLMIFVRRETSRSKERAYKR